MAATLAICELFRSIQGESAFAGLPCGFVRTTGCNLRCRWCDTKYAYAAAGETRPVRAVAEELISMDTPLVCITGGEPLLQTEGTVALAERLLGAGLTVLLETNGTMDVRPVPEGVIRVMDVKCPSSGECGRTLPENLEALRPRDEVKFVIADREDFDWALDFVRERRLVGGAKVLFAPVCDELAPQRLAEWILECGQSVRLQLQLHKILWPDRPRGV